MWVLRRFFCSVLVSVRWRRSARQEGCFQTCGAAITLPPNVVLITLDTTRADRMGFLGSDRGLTPNLDELANQGVVFTRAYSHVPLTPPSHATILTGTYPQFNHVDDFGSRLAGGDCPISGHSAQERVPDGGLCVLSDSGSDSRARHRDLIVGSTNMTPDFTSNTRERIGTNHRKASGRGSGEG